MVGVKGKTAWRSIGRRMSSSCSESSETVSLTRFGRFAKTISRVCCGTAGDLMRSIHRLRQCLPTKGRVWKVVQSAVRRSSPTTLTLRQTQRSKSGRRERERGAVGFADA